MGGVGRDPKSEHVRRAAVRRELLRGLARRPGRKSLVQMTVDVRNSVIDEVKLTREALNLRFRTAVYVVIQFAAEAVFRILAILAHHNHWRLNGSQHR